MRFNYSGDPLTGALNRRAFSERAEQELLRSRRHGTVLSLSVLDLDHFKQINDRYGHTIGDEVLRRFSQHCQEQIRSSDLFARYGGEEFVLLLPETDPTQAASLLERLRERWAMVALATSDQPLRSTVSIGLVEVDSTTSLDKSFDQADAALYRAKHAGRNRLKIG